MPLTPLGKLFIPQCSTSPLPEGRPTTVKKVDSYYLLFRAIEPPWRSPVTLAPGWKPHDILILVIRFIGGSLIPLLDFLCIPSLCSPRVWLSADSASQLVSDMGWFFHLTGSDSSSRVVSLSLPPGRPPSEKKSSDFLIRKKSPSSTNHLRLDIDLQSLSQPDRSMLLKQ